MALKYKSENGNGFRGLGHLFSDLVRDSKEFFFSSPKPTSGDIFCFLLCVFSRAPHVYLDVVSYLCFFSS